MSTPQEVVANVLDIWTQGDTLHVTERVLDALEAAGYAVVPVGETEHIVDFNEDGFVVQHPLACRSQLGGLLSCHYNNAFFDGPPDAEPGKYRFRFEGGKPVLMEKVA